MLRQAILDIGRPRFQSRTLLWINDDHPDALGWVTAFGPCAGCSAGTRT